MFTGIVQTMGRVAELQPRDYGRRLVIERRGWSPWGGAVIREGDSISVSGVCLTVAEVTEQTLAFDVIFETLQKTSLGDLAPGDPVNLEPSVTPNQPMGGHFVQGHIEGVGVIRSVQEGEDWRIRVDTPAELLEAIVPKGSVAIDGVSMTVAQVFEDGFELAVIPTTIRLTTLGRYKAGQRVNLETDIVSRTVVYTLKQMIDAGTLGNLMGNPAQKG
jgi:riboflavin synthase alpha subunit